MAGRNRRLDAVAVLGLGRFGTSLALELMKEDVEVLAVDSDQRIVESLTLAELPDILFSGALAEDSARRIAGKCVEQQK